MSENSNETQNALLTTVVMWILTILFAIVVEYMLKKLWRKLVSWIKSKKNDDNTVPAT